MNERDKEAITELIEKRAHAHHDRDAAAIAAPYAPDAVRYDLAPPLLHRGMDRRELESWLATWGGPITIDTEELHVVVDGALAVAWGLTRMRGRKAAEGDQDLWFRSTIVLEKTAGTWRIVHEHASVPFYMDGSDRAAVDLKPANETSRTRSRRRA